MIEINNVSKSFVEICANKNISLTIENGKLIGLIGPDGAGKSTLMRQICSLISPDKGNIYVDSLDTVKHQSAVRSIIGYMPQKFSLYPDLTVEQNIRFFADLFNVPAKERKIKIEQLYQFSMLAPFKDRQAGKLSGGMKQKLALSCNLVHTPKYLILDEPTFGVDPVSRQEFWDLILQIKQEGTTIFVSTPYLDEAEMFDSVALMFEAELIDFNTPHHIIENFPYSIFSVKSDHINFFKKLANVVHIHFFGNDLHIAFDTVPEKSDWDLWIEQGIVINYKLRKATLEDVFLMRENNEHN